MTKVEQNAILAKLEQMRVENATRDEKISAMLRTLNEDHATLNGNGKTGLKTRVELLEQSLSSISSWLKVVVGVAVAQTAFIVVGLLTHTIDVVK